jgi:hypothetical protein
MDVDIFCPTIYLIQYNLRESLDDSKADILHKSESFYRKFLPKDKELGEYRKREKSDTEFNQVLVTPSEISPQQLLPHPLKGHYYPVQMGDSYALQICYSGEKACQVPLTAKENQKDLSNAFSDLRKDLQETDFPSLKKIHPKLDGNTLEQNWKKLLPDLDENSFGQTWILTGFIDNVPLDPSDILNSCYAQIRDKSDPNSDREWIDCGEWYGGKLFELWKSPVSCQDNLKEILDKHPHIIVWLFPVDKFDYVENDRVFAKNYDLWIELFHYRHKIFYAYHKSQLIKRKLKSANSNIRNISDQLKSQNIYLPQIKDILFDTLAQFQAYSNGIQDLKNQQQTLETNRYNYRLICGEMMKKDAGSNLQFLLEFENKYGNKYDLQIRADRSHLDSGLERLENLSQTIQSIVQIKQAQNAQITTTVIGIFAIILALIQVYPIVLAPKPPANNTPTHQTSAF